MIITCDSCGTRFHLAEGRIGAKGAKVRCSNCHHRFHVAPPTSGGPGEPEVEDSVETPAAVPAADEAAPATQGHMDAALDNPQFLFDGPTPDGEGAPGNEVSLSGEVTQITDEDEDDGGDEPDTGSSPLFGIDADAAERQEELSGEFSSPSLAASEDPIPVEHSTFEPEASAEPEMQPEPADFGAGRSGELDLDDGPEVEGIAELAGDLDLEAAEDAAQQMEQPDSGLSLADGPSLDLGGNLDGAADSDPLSSLVDEMDDPLSSWDALDQPGAGESAPLASAPAQPVKPAAVTQRDEAAMPGLGDDFPLDEGSPARGFAMQIVAFAIGAALVFGGARAALWRMQPPGPELTRGAGWTAERVEAFYRRDAQGQRVLIVRGALTGDRAAAAPRVSAQLVDGAGHAVGAAAPALLQRLDGSALDPEPLGAVLASREAAAPRGPIEGFTALIAEPPPEARGFELRLEPGPSRADPRLANAPADPARGAPAESTPPAAPAD